MAIGENKRESVSGINLLGGRREMRETEVYSIRFRGEYRGGGPHSEINDNASDEKYAASSGS